MCMFFRPLQTDDKDNKSYTALYPVMVKHPLSWLASMMLTPKGRWSLRVEFNYAPASASPDARFDSEHPASKAGIYGARHNCLF